MAAIAVVGWLLGRYGVLGTGAEQVLARAVFTIAAPCLLMVTIAEADLRVLLSRTALAVALSTTVVAVLSAAVSRWLWRAAAGDAMVVILASSYVNAGNLGLPLAVYVLGDPLAVVPTLLFQLLVLAPAAFTVLESRPATGGPVPPDGVAPRRGGLRSAMGRTLRNPILIGTFIGLLLAVLPWDAPAPLLEPFRLIGAAAAPLALITFGMSLAPSRKSRERSLTRDLVLVVVIRSALHPCLAALIGSMLGLDGAQLLAVVLMAALPTAQNVLVYAMRYGREEALARNAVLVTTLLAGPVMMVVAATLLP